MILVTYLLVCMTYMLGALWSKLNCPLCTRKLLGVPVNGVQSSLKTFSCSEMEEGRNSGMKDPLMDESELMFPSQDSVKAIHHDIPVTVGNKSIFALTNDSSVHVAQHLEPKDNRLTGHGSSLILPLSHCGPVRSSSANACDSAREEKREKSAPLPEVSSARRTFHESASSFGLEHFVQLFHSGYGEESTLGSPPKRNQCLISCTSDKTQASAGAGGSIKEVSKPAVDEMNSGNPVKRLRRKSAPSKGHRDVVRQHHIRQKIARYRSESRRRKSMGERNTDGSLHTAQEIYMYENALFMEDSFNLDNDLSAGESILGA